MNRSSLRQLERTLEILEASKVDHPVGESSLANLRETIRLAKEYPNANAAQIASLLAQQPFMKVANEIFETFRNGPEKIDFGTAIKVAAKKEPALYRRYLAATGRTA